MYGVGRHGVQGHLQRRGTPLRAPAKPRAALTFVSSSSETRNFIQLPSFPPFAQCVLTPPTPHPGLPPIPTPLLTSKEPAGVAGSLSHVHCGQLPVPMASGALVYGGSSGGSTAPSVVTFPPSCSLWSVLLPPLTPEAAHICLPRKHMICGLLTPQSATVLEPLAVPCGHPLGCQWTTVSQPEPHKSFSFPYFSPPASNDLHVIFTLSPKLLLKEA